MSHDFVCKICAKTGIYNDQFIPIVKIAEEVQTKLIDLKHNYLTKKTHILDRLAKHKSKVEEYFKMYYDILDAFRFEYLNKEYDLCGSLEDIEVSIKRMLHMTGKMTMVEFFNEQYDL